MGEDEIILRKLDLQVEYWKTILNIVLIISIGIIFSLFVANPNLLTWRFLAISFSFIFIAFSIYNYWVLRTKKYLRRLLLFLGF